MSSQGASRRENCLAGHQAGSRRLHWLQLSSQPPLYRPWPALRSRFFSESMCACGSMEGGSQGDVRTVQTAPHAGTWASVPAWRLTQGSDQHSPASKRAPAP